MKGRPGTDFRLPLASLKWFLMHLPLCSWRGKLMEAGCVFIPPSLLLSVTCLPLASKASVPFGSSPAHFTDSHSFPALYPTAHVTSSALPDHYPHPHPLWELNIELTSSLKVGILLLGTWCYFFFSAQISKLDVISHRDTDIDRHSLLFLGVLVCRVQCANFKESKTISVYTCTQTGKYTRMPLHVWQCVFLVTGWVTGYIKVVRC